MVDVALTQFFAWKRRLRQTASGQFVEVQVVGVEAQAAAHGRAIEIRLSGGHSVIVEPGFDAGHLRAVVAALEGLA